MCSLFAKQVARNTFQTFICQNGIEWNAMNWMENFLCGGFGCEYNVI